MISFDAPPRMAYGHDNSGLYAPLSRGKICDSDTGKIKSSSGLDLLPAGTSSRGHRDSYPSTGKAMVSCTGHLVISISRQSPNAGRTVCGSDGTDFRRLKIYRDEDETFDSSHRINRVAMRDDGSSTVH